MRTSAFLAVVAAIQVEVVAGLHGRAAPFEEREDYVVTSCSLMKEADSACGGQCAEVWCDGEETGDCTFEGRLLARVADRCAPCARGDLLLSRDVFLQLSLADVSWIPVRWGCVECEVGRGGNSTGSENAEFQVIQEAICPGSAAVEVCGGNPSAENSTSEAIENESASGGDASFHDIGSSASVENDTSGSFDALFDVPATSTSRSGSEGESCSNNSWSSSGSTQTDTKPWNGQGQNTAPPIPIEPRPKMPSSSSSSFTGASSTPPPVPATTIIPASSSSAGSSHVPPPRPPSNGGYRPAVSPAASTSSAIGDTNFPIGTVSAPAENPQDAVRSAPPGSSDSSSTTAETADKNQSPASTTAQPSSSPDSADKSSSGGNLSATAAVAKSPFFYAAVVLAVVGLVGAIVGFRAKRKRNHRNEMMALRVSARQSTRTATPTSNSRPAPTPASARLDRHSLVIL